VFFKVYTNKLKNFFFAATCWTGGNRGMVFFKVIIYKSKKYFLAATSWTGGNRGMGVFLRYICMYKWKNCFLCGDMLDGW
jgi:hypothetical protein